MTNTQIEALASYCAFSTIATTFALFCAWDAFDGWPFPIWWSRRHAAIITIFLPVTFALSLPFWVGLGVWKIITLVRFLARLAFTFDPPRGS